jgi:hypothetical protein
MVSGSTNSSIDVSLRKFRERGAHGFVRASRGEAGAAPKQSLDASGGSVFRN